MDTGRVGACHKLENKRRKFLIVINDVVKNKYLVHADYLDHAHAEAESNYEKSKMFVRRALVRQKVLQTCMQMRKRTVETKPEYGRYGGKPIDAFTRDIEGFIAHHHPKLRRKRYLEKLLAESLEKGAILKPTVVEDKVSNWMERSYTKYKLMKAKREKTVLEPINEKAENSGRSKLRRGPQRIPKLPVLSNPFYSGAINENNDDKTSDNDPKPTEINDIDVAISKDANVRVGKKHGAGHREKDQSHLADTNTQLHAKVMEGVSRKLDSVHLTEEGATQASDKRLAVIRETEGETLGERRTLVLPPIKSTKAMMAT